MQSESENIPANGLPKRLLAGELGIEFNNRCRRGKPEHNSSHQPSI